MSWALRELGLRPDADERAIKRAYAAKLKTTRPEEDPQGFQALNEAYQAALAWHRAQEARMLEDSGGHGVEAASADEDASNVVAPPAATVPSSVETPQIAAPVQANGADAGHEAEERNSEEIDPERFFGECFAAARDGDPRVIERWLNAQPILWSLQHKAMIGHWLLRAIHERTPPMPERNFDRIADFFGYHELHGGYDPLALRELRMRVNDAWRWTREAAPTQHVAKNAGHDWTPNQLQEHRHEQREIALLQKLGRNHRFIFEKSSRLRMLWRALNPMRVAAIGALLRQHAGCSIEGLPWKVDPIQARFWLDASEPLRWTRWRLLTVAIRCLLCAPAFAVFLLLNAEGSEDLGFVYSLSIVELLAWSLASVAGIWMLYAAWRSFLYWLGRPDPESIGLRWLHRLALPAIALLSPLAAMQETMNPLAYLFGATAAYAAVRRYRGRNGSVFAPSTGTHRFLASLTGQTAVVAALLSLFMVATMLQPLLALESSIPIVLLSLWGVSLTLWIRDLVRQRKR